MSSEAREVVLENPPLENYAEDLSEPAGDVVQAENSRPRVSTARAMFKKMKAFSRRICAFPWRKRQKSVGQPEEDLLDPEDLDDPPEREWNVVDSLELYSPVPRLRRPKPDDLVDSVEMDSPGPSVPEPEPEFDDLVDSVELYFPGPSVPEPESECDDLVDSEELHAPGPYVPEPHLEEDLDDPPVRKLNVVDSLELYPVIAPPPKWFLDVPELKTKAKSELSRLENYVPLNVFQLEDRLKQCTLLEQRHVTNVWLKVYIGDEAIATNRDALEELCITHVLNAAAQKKDLKYYLGTRTDEDKAGFVNTGSSYYRGLHISYHGFPLADKRCSDISKYFRPAARLINKALDKRENQVLICCKEGVEHSATLFLAYLMICHDMMLEEAIDDLITCRRISPSRDALKKLMLLNAELVQQRKLKLQDTITGSKLKAFSRRICAFHQRKRQKSVEQPEEDHLDLEDMDDPPEREWNVVNSLEMYSPVPRLPPPEREDLVDSVELYAPGPSVLEPEPECDNLVDSVALYASSTSVPEPEPECDDLVNSVELYAPGPSVPEPEPKCEWEHLVYSVLLYVPGPSVPKPEPESEWDDLGDSAELHAPGPYVPEPHLEEDLDDPPVRKLNVVDSLELYPVIAPPTKWFLNVPDRKTKAKSELSKLENYVPLNVFQLEDRLKQCTLLEQRHVTNVWLKVYIGDEAIATNRDALEELCITHVLNAAAQKKDLKYYLGTRTDEDKAGFVNTGSSYYRGLHISYHGFPLADKRCSDISKYFRPAARLINKALDKRENQVLICCKEGVEHSATLFLAYLMICHDMMLEEAIDDLITCRRISPSRDALKKLMLLNAELVQQRKLKLQDTITGSKLKAFSRRISAFPWRKKQKSVEQPEVDLLDPEDMDDPPEREWNVVDSLELYSPVPRLPRPEPEDLVDLMELYAPGPSVLEPEPECDNLVNSVELYAPSTSVPEPEPECDDLVNSVELYASCLSVFEPEPECDDLADSVVLHVPGPSVPKPEPKSEWDDLGDSAELHAPGPSVPEPEPKCEWEHLVYSVELHVPGPSAPKPEPESKWDDLGDLAELHAPGPSVPEPEPKCEWEHLVYSVELHVPGPSVPKPEPKCEWEHLVYSVVLHVPGPIVPEPEPECDDLVDSEELHAPGPSVPKPEPESKWDDLGDSAELHVPGPIVPEPELECDDLLDSEELHAPGPSVPKPEPESKWDDLVDSEELHAPGPYVPEPHLEEDLDDPPEREWNVVDSLELYPVIAPPTKWFLNVPDRKTKAKSELSKLENYVPLNVFQLEDRLKQCTLLEQRHVTNVWLKVYIGDEAIATNRDALEELCITHVLNAAAQKKDLKYYLGTRTDEDKAGFVNTGSSYYRGLHISYHGFPLADKRCSDISKYFRPAARLINKALDKRENQVLICCKEGVEHSATLFLVYLMICHDMMLEEAIDDLITCRRISPSRDALKKLMLLNAELVQQRKLKLQDTITGSKLKAFSRRICAFHRRKRQKSVEQPEEDHLDLEDMDDPPEREWNVVDSLELYSPVPRLRRPKPEDLVDLVELYVGN